MRCLRSLSSSSLVSFLGAATPLGAQPFQTEPKLAPNCYDGAVEIDANDGVLGGLDDCGESPRMALTERIDGSARAAPSRRGCLLIKRPPGNESQQRALGSSAIACRLRF